MLEPLVEATKSWIIHGPCLPTPIWQGLWGNGRTQTWQEPLVILQMGGKIDRFGDLCGLYSIAMLPDVASVKYIVFFVSSKRSGISRPIFLPLSHQNFWSRLNPVSTSVNLLMVEGATPTRQPHQLNQPKVHQSTDDIISVGKCLYVSIVWIHMYIYNIIQSYASYMEISPVRNKKN